MPWSKKISIDLRGEWQLWAIVLLAFLVRIVGIGYGLPLQVINDETPFTLAALQMIQSHTLIPALHPELFKSILPYPPYLSYVLILPFVVILAIKYLLFHGTATLFAAHVVTDLSAFFATARIFSVVLGTISVYLVYRLGERVFHSRIAATASAFLLATSLLHEALSMVGRNWMPVSFLFALIFYFLTKPSLSIERRYLFAFIVAGIGMGISSICAFFCIFIAFYYFLYDAKATARGFLKDVRSLAPGIVAFFLLAAVPSFLYHNGNVFLGVVTIFAQKSFLGLLGSPFTALSLLVFSEPMLIVFFALGLGLLLAQKQRAGLLMLVWFFCYVATFYLLFRFDPRFMAPLLPLFALAGGYCVSFLWTRYTAVLLSLLLLVPLAASLRLSQLAILGDTRAHARAWVLTHLSPQDKILVFSSAMHIPTEPAAVDELAGIDSNAVRKLDQADKTIGRKDVPYALNNLTSIANDSFDQDLASYAKEHGYMYLMLEPRSLPGLPRIAPSLLKLTNDASLLQEWKGLGDNMSLSESAFLEPLAQLFSSRTLGPDMIIYKIHD